MRWGLLFFFISLSVFAENFPGARVVEERSYAPRWIVSESANFKLFHKNSIWAIEVLKQAEKARKAVYLKWLRVSAPTDWFLKCEIYLYPSAWEYNQATGMSIHTPGHADIKTVKGNAAQVQSRRIDLREDLPYMLYSVLPHEVTHVTLAGNFGQNPLPRWADEGLAMLSETYEQIGKHLDPLLTAYQSKAVFLFSDFLSSDLYPESSRLPVFYAQSVAAVQYLTLQRGTSALIRFLQEANQSSFIKSLKNHYGLESHELDEKVYQYVVRDGAPKLRSP